MKRAFYLLAAATASCSPFTQRVAEYGGMPLAGEPAVMFAPGIVSTGDVFASTFTPDGRTVVFTKFAAPRMWLMSSTLSGAGWSAPTPLGFSGTYRDLDPAFTPDGSRLYFSSWRPVTEASRDTSNTADTWYVDRQDTGWSAPVRLPSPVNSADVDMYPSATKRGALYFDSQRSRPSRRQVYRAEPNVDGTFGEPRLLDATVNADSGASNFFVDPDEQYAVFGARRPDSRGMDLYISWRRRGAWTTPRNLGPGVNTDGTEFCPFVSRDGRYLYFTRVTPGTGSAVVRNIYVVRFDELRRSLAPG